MSTLLVDQDIVTENARAHLISALRSALNSAESEQNEVTVYFENMEITWNFEDGEFFVIG